MGETIEGKSGRAWIILIACCIMCAIGFGGVSTCFSLFVTPLVSELDTSVTSVSLFFVLMMAFGIPGAVIAPRLLEKNAGLASGVGGVIAGLGYLLVANVPSLPTLYVAAALMGFGSSFTTTLMAPILINNWFNVKQGTFVGVALAFTGIGGAILSPVVTGIIASNGWQFAMTALGCLIAVVVGGLGFLCIRYSPETCGCEPYGQAKAALSAEGAPAEVDDAFAKQGMSFKEFFRAPAAFLVMGAVLFAGFIACINQQANTICQLSGFTAVAAGLVVSCQSIGNVIGKLLLGAVRDRFGGPKAGLMGAFFAILGFCCMIAGVLGQAETLMFAGGFICGLGSCLGTMAAPLFTMDAAGPREYGNILGVVSVFGAIGAAVGTVVVSALYDASGSYVSALVVLAVLAVAIVPFAFAGIKGLQKKWKSA